MWGRAVANMHMVRLDTGLVSSLKKITQPDLIRKGTWNLVSGNHEDVAPLLAHLGKGFSASHSASLTAGICITTFGNDHTFFDNDLKMGKQEGHRHKKRLVGKARKPLFIGWWRDPESNRGHKDFQSSALPTELSRLGEKELIKAIAVSASTAFAGVFQPPPKTAHPRVSPFAAARRPRSPAKSSWWPYLKSCMKWSACGTRPYSP